MGWHHTSYALQQNERGQNQTEGNGQTPMKTASRLSAFTWTRSPVRFHPCAPPGQLCQLHRLPF